jgi:hypothetical protein
MTKLVAGVIIDRLTPGRCTLNPIILRLLVTTLCGLPAVNTTGQNSLPDSIINSTSLRQVVEVLASDSLQGRFTGTLQAQTAASFIAEEFKKAGTTPPAGNDGYFMSFLTSGDSVRLGINVMGVLKGTGKPDELVIFCAHYDHVGTKSTNPFDFSRSRRSIRQGDTIYNGANDNASGVSALIHLARYFGQLKNNKRTVIFIAFAGEELGLKGSLGTVSFFKPEQVIAVINIEMIGRPISKKRRTAFITGSHLTDIQKLLNKKLYESDRELYGKKFFTPDPFPDANLFERSDNYWFAMKGIPAHTIMGCGPDDDYYHSPADETQTLDFTLMERRVKAIAISTSILVEGAATPSRLNKDRINSGL